MSDYPGGDTPLYQQNKNKFSPDNQRHQHTAYHVGSERTCIYPQRQIEYITRTIANAIPTFENTSGQVIVKYSLCLSAHSVSDTPSPYQVA
ncbi:hypothetical protein, partial [Escherichia coli]|uniref:hypothetical protein n=1 Tax=Escherichia coli TaxID=562 RepID=UPI001BC8A437